MGNLYQNEGSQYSYIGSQMSGVKRCLNVAKEKMFHALHLKKKADLWGRQYPADAKTVHASDVHKGQTKMDMFVAKVKNIAGKLLWNMKKNRNLDSCVDQNVVACHDARKTSKVLDGSSLGIQEVIDEL